MATVKFYFDLLVYIGWGLFVAYALFEIYREHKTQVDKKQKTVKIKE